MIRYLAALLLGVFTVSLHAQMDFSKIEVKTEKLTDNLYMLIGAGGNVGLSVGDDAIFVIDDQFAPMAPKIKAAIAAVTRKPVQFVLNTHFHFDHTGGNEAMGKDGALIVAHDNVRRRLSAEQLISFIGMRQAATPKVGLPAVTVTRDITFHINGDEVQAFHVPNAHTDGDLIVHFRNGNVVHMGDTYFKGAYPFIDSSSGGSADGLVAALDRVLAAVNDRTKIIPGHGPLSNKAELQTWRNMVATVTQRIKDQRKAGKSDADIIAARIAADFDPTYGAGFISAERFVPMMLGAIPK